MTKSKHLTDMQRRFVEAFMATGGDRVEAARTAGYKGSAKVLQGTADKLVKKAHIQAAIDTRADEDPLVATREDRQRFWTRVMNGEPFSQVDPDDNKKKKRVKVPANMVERLKASSLLGKSQGDFVKRVEIGGEVSHVHTFELPDNGRTTTEDE